LKNTPDYGLVLLSTLWTRSRINCLTRDIWGVLPFPQGLTKIQDWGSLPVSEVFIWLFTHILPRLLMGIFARP